MFSWLLISLPVGILVYAFATQANHPQTQKALNGYLDLSTWDATRDGTLNLDGEWTFYWNRLLTPPMLASEETIRRLDNRNEFVMRFVDKAKAKGKTEPVGIWEIMGRISEMPGDFVAQGLPRFEEAMQHYRNGHTEQARDAFAAYLALYTTDRVAQIYLGRCEDILAKPPA